MMLKRLISVCIVCALILAVLPMTVFSATAPKPITLAELKQKYPDGKYWNGGNAEGYTSLPCTHHKTTGCEYDGSCGCNTFKDTSIQCMGFANQLAYIVYGGNPYYDWTKYYGNDAFNSIKAGDIVRYKNGGHSIFVTAVDDNYITFADCNYTGNCKIRWDVKISKTELKSTFSYVARAPYEWDVSSGSSAPACECTDSYAGEYKCITENYPLNIRAGHGSSYKKIGEIPKGATVTVTMSDGDWAHVIYDDITGFASMEYLQLVKPKADLSLDKNIINLDIPHNKTASVTMTKSSGLPADAKITFDYDKEVISLTQSGNTLKITALKEGETDLVVEASDKDGIIVSVKCGIFIKKSVHDYGNYVSDKNATSEKDGTKTRTCNTCGAKDTVTESGTKLINSAQKFSDVESNGWYKPYVDYTYTKGIFNGSSNTTFSPDEPMTRAQFVMVLANISGVDTSKYSKKTKFIDVPENKWYAGAVKWAYDNKIANGVSDNEFSPEETITREQMCVMLLNYVTEYKKTALNKTENKIVFADDNKISVWAKIAVYECQRAGLINGVGDNKFNPQGIATRSQGATIFTFFHKAYF